MSTPAVNPPFSTPSMHEEPRALAFHGENSLARRLAALAIAICCAAVLGVAAWLTPSPTGMGTHTQMGAPNCGWIVLLDLPCPTCGMTTAFVHAADGHFTQSFMAQPVGCLLAILTAMSFILCVYIAVTGSPLAWWLGRRFNSRFFWLAAALVTVGWLYKVSSYKGWFT